MGYTEGMVIDFLAYMTYGKLMMNLTTEDEMADFREWREGW